MLLVEAPALRFVAFLPALEFGRRVLALAVRVDYIAHIRDNRVVAFAAVRDVSCEIVLNVDGVVAAFAVDGIVATAEFVDAIAIFVPSEAFDLVVAFSSGDGINTGLVRVSDLVVAPFTGERVVAGLVSILDNVVSVSLASFTG